MDVYSSPVVQSTVYTVYTPQFLTSSNPQHYRGLQVGWGTAAELKVTHANIIDH